MRAKRYGTYRIVQCNSAILKHHPAVTCEKKLIVFSLKYGVTDPVRIYYQVRNALYMTSEYKSLRAFSIVVVKILKIIILFENKKNYTEYVLRAFKDYKLNITGKFEG